MTVVLVEGGYRNVSACYMRRTQTAPDVAALGFGQHDWTLFDEDGRKCVCAFEKAPLFYWAHEHDIEVVTVQ